MARGTRSTFVFLLFFFFRRIRVWITWKEFFFNCSHAYTQWLLAWWTRVPFAVRRMFYSRCHTSHSIHKRTHTPNIWMRTSNKDWTKGIVCLNWFNKCTYAEIKRKKYIYHRIRGVTSHNWRKQTTPAAVAVAAAADARFFFALLFSFVSFLFVLFIFCEMRVCRWF